MSKYSRDYLEEGKKLPDLFKEVQDIRYGRAKPQMTDSEKNEIQFNRIYVVDHRFNAAGAILGILFLILFVTSIKTNYIFAVTPEEKIAITHFEENKNAINMMETISQNISAFTKKEIINKEIEKEYEVIYVESNLLPKDEQKVVQEGENGITEQTIILTYENEELVGENVLNELEISKPVEHLNFYLKIKFMLEM